MSLKSRISSALFPLFCAFGLLLFPGIPAFAQSASVSGRVIDPSSAVVRKAQITLIDVAKGTSQTTQTNDGGFYSLPFVQPGTYALAVEANGFKRFERTKITVETAQSLVLDVRLQVGDVSQSVTVDGSGNSINTTDASVSTVIDRQFVQNIPLNGRSFQSLLTMVPGVMVTPTPGDGVGASGEITVNGQRTEENYFTVDGVSVNTGESQKPGGVSSAGFSGSVPGETALGTTQSMVSIDDLQEFRATTSTYSAEYGRTPGGQFIFQTRSGTNHWHGSAFEYLRNDALDANNYFNKFYTPFTPRQAERQNDFGGTLGGPMIIPHLYNGKDRTFFFFSYEGLRLQQPQAATQTGVPSLNLRANGPAEIQPFLNAFPLPNGTDFGNGEATYTGGYTAPASIDTTSIRIDHHFGDRFQVFGRYSDVPSSSQNRTASDLSVARTTGVNVKSLTLGATNTFTPKLTSDLRFNSTWNNFTYNATTDSYGGATQLSSQYLNSIPGYPQGNSILVYFEPTDWLLYSNYPAVILQPFSNDQHQLNIVETMNAALGRHNLKWGVDYRRLLTAGSLPAFEQTLSYNSEDQISTDQPQINAWIGPSRFTPVYTDFSAFLQDEWKATSRLNLSLGLRWELSPAPKDAHGENPYAVTTTDIAMLALASKNTPLWQTTYGNFAPRFGLAYQVHQQPGYETVLRAGAGVFYDTSSVNGSFGYGGQGLTNEINIPGGTTTFPLTQAQINAIPAPNAEPPYEDAIMGFDPHLKLPYTWEWNLAVEQALGSAQTLTLSYIGSAGRRLLSQGLYFPSSAVNPNFDGAYLYLVTNASSSDYNALQVQFQRKMSHNLQALASYTWSHSLDNLSSNFSEYELLWADSDFDVRNNFQLGLVYQVPANYDNKLLTVSLKGWAIDARISSRSALPVNIYGKYTELSNGQSVFYQADRVPGEPVYLHGSQYPGGRVINFSAFRDAANPLDGTAGRNFARGFGATQADLAVNRTFPIKEGLNLRFRAEAYNVFNQAIMGSIYSYLSNGPNEFGYAHNTENEQLGGLSSLYQVGGPRSLQLSLHLQF